MQRKNTQQASKRKQKNHQPFAAQGQVAGTIPGSRYCVCGGEYATAAVDLQVPGGP